MNYIKWMMKLAAILIYERQCGAHMVDKALTSLNKSPNSDTKYIVIPAALAQDSQYPFGEDVDVVEISIDAPKKELRIVAVTTPYLGEGVRVTGRKTRGKDAEFRVQEFLIAAGLKFVTHPELYGKPDFLVERKIVIFCQSSFWHGKAWDKLKQKLQAGSNADYWIDRIEKTRQQDQRIDKELNRSGYKVIRFWEEDIYSDPAACIKKVKDELRPKRK